MSELLHNYGLVRFSKKTGKVDKAMKALGKGLIQAWALQNTPKTKACLIVDLDERKPVIEYVGTVDGFPEIHKTEKEFDFNVPDNIYDYFGENFPAKEDTEGRKVKHVKTKFGSDASNFSVGTTIIVHAWGKFEESTMKCIGTKYSEFHGEDVFVFDNGIEWTPADLQGNFALWESRNGYQLQAG